MDRRWREPLPGVASFLRAPGRCGEGEWANHKDSPLVSGGAVAALAGAAMFIARFIQPLFGVHPLYAVD